LQGLGRIAKNTGVVSFLAETGKRRLPNTQMEVIVTRAGSAGVSSNIYYITSKVVRITEIEHGLHMRTSIIEGLYICSIEPRFHNFTHKVVTSLLHGVSNIGCGC